MQLAKAKLYAIEKVLVRPERERAVSYDRQSKQMNENLLRLLSTICHPSHPRVMSRTTVGVECELNIMARGLCSRNSYKG